jgi:hypothetical protein
MDNILCSDNKLFKLIKENFNDSDMEIFYKNYELYIKSKDDDNIFYINFDEIYKWLGFSSRDTAKKLLMKTFIIDVDYEINNKCNKILLTINCYKKFCLIADTKEGYKIHNYYIKMQEIIYKYIMEKHGDQLEEYPICMENIANIV